MSTLRCDNFGPSAGGTTYSARGVAKAWVNFNGTGTIAARDSENVSSLTDNGTGDYTVNFSSSFDAGDYSIMALGNMGSGYSEPRVMGNTDTSPATNSCRLRAYNLGVANPFDPPFACGLFHGDLA